MTQKFTLRAMARNYANGHSWDRLDGEVCIKAADEIEQLRAEVAGLKTGYEAYERVNAELKAEVEALRNALSDLLDLYDDDEGCRNLPQYIAFRAAMGKGEQS